MTLPCRSVDIEGLLTHFYKFGPKLPTDSIRALQIVFVLTFSNRADVKLLYLILYLQ
jgi:hypothetical protein